MNKITGKRFSCITFVYASLAAVIVIVSALSCSSKTIMTEPLFMQTKRAEIMLPNQDALKIDSATGAAIVEEVVTYETPDKVVIKDFIGGDDDIIEDLTVGVQHLSEVVVVAQSRYTAEREGRVTVDFMVQVPKELLSPNWRVILRPTILHNDSLVPLQEILLKGVDFDAKQKSDYKEYSDYVGAIVDKADYDEVFLDRENILRDMRKHQYYYWDKYQKEWKRQLGYEKWKFEREDQDAYYIAKQIGYRYKKYNELSIDAQNEAIEGSIQGKDTTGTRTKYMNSFRKKVKGMPTRYVKPVLREKDVPKKFRYIHATGRTMRDLTNDVLTESDSILISGDRYFFDQITMNEVAAERKDEIFDLLIKYPYMDSTAFRLDTIVDANDDFTYLYRQNYEVVEGLKKLGLTMTGQIQAIDRSAYTLRDADTISYFISSLAQLMDTTLSTRSTTVYRNSFKSLTFYPKYAPNKSEFDLGYEDNKKEMQKFLDQYNDITTARGMVMDSILLTVTGSLDGNFENNDRLARRRSIDIKQYVTNALPESSNVRNIMQANSIGEDWETLISLVKKSKLSNKDKIVEKLEAGKSNPDYTEAELRLLYRADYNTMRETLYPPLRRAEVTFYMHRPNMDQTELVEAEFLSGYDEALRLLEDREYSRALEILSNYPDYNTALALACLGQNGKAHELLITLPSSANTEYLLAIVLQRLGKAENNEKREADGAEHLVKACELDPSRVYRIPLDNEARYLLNKFELQDRINAVTRSQDEADNLLLRENDEMNIKDEAKEENEEAN